MFSDGDLRDQKGPFDTTSFGLSEEVFGGEDTWSTGTNDDGRRVLTANLTVTAGLGLPITMSTGTSETKVCRLDWNGTFKCWD